MRIPIKIILSPLVVVLAVFSAIIRFVFGVAKGLLAIISSLAALIMLLSLILPTGLKIPTSNYILVFVMAFLISPFGIPALAEWLADKIDDLNIAIRSI